MLPDDHEQVRGNRSGFTSRSMCSQRELSIVCKVSNSASLCRLPCREKEKSNSMSTLLIWAIEIPDGGLRAENVDVGKGPVIFVALLREDGWTGSKERIRSLGGNSAWQ